jgi:hypothetical protein
VDTGFEMLDKMMGKNKDDLGDDKASNAVKAKVKAVLSGKRINNAEEEKALLQSVYNEYSGLGLKGISFTPSKDKLGMIDVIVSASLPERVAQMDMGTPRGLNKIDQVAGRMSPYAKRTTIYVYYDMDQKSLGTVTQSGGQAGHAEMYLRLRFPEFLDLIRSRRNRLRTPLGQPIPIHLDINRTPCDGCATSHIQELINQARTNYSDVPISLTISSSSISQGAQITTQTGLLALINQGVTLTSSTVWTEIKRQMQANRIVQLEYGTRAYDIDDVNEFIANAGDVQSEIDKAIASLQSTRPAPGKMGSGV